MESVKTAMPEGAQNGFSWDVENPENPKAQEWQANDSQAPKKKGRPRKTPAQVFDTIQAQTLDKSMEIAKTPETQTTNNQSTQDNPPKDNPNQTAPAPQNLPALRNGGLPGPNSKKLKAIEHAQTYIAQALYSTTGVIKTPRPISIAKTPDPKFKPLYADLIEQLIQQWPDYIDQTVATKEDGSNKDGAQTTVKVTKRAPAPPITQMTICLFLGINENTINKWMKDQPKLIRIMQNNATKCKSMLTNHALLGNYNSNFAQFYATNFLGIGNLQQSPKNTQNNAETPIADQSEEQLNADTDRLLDRLLGTQETTAQGIADELSTAMEQTTTG